MRTEIFDTIRIAKDLEATGFSRAQSERITIILYEIATSSLVTKVDLELALARQSIMLQVAEWNTSGARGTLVGLIQYFNQCRRCDRPLSVPGVRHRLTSSCAVVQLHIARRAVVRTAQIAAQGHSHFSEMIPTILDTSDRRHRSDHVIEDAFRRVWQCDLPFCQLGRESAIARSRAMLGICPVD